MSLGVVGAAAAAADWYFVGRCSILDVVVDGCGMGIPWRRVSAGFAWGRKSVQQLPLQ